jgi:hypothetical protein
LSPTPVRLQAQSVIPHPSDDPMMLFTFVLSTSYDAQFHITIYPGRRPFAGRKEMKHVPGQELRIPAGPGIQRVQAYDRAGNAHIRPAAPATGPFPSSAESGRAVKRPGQTAFSACKRRFSVRTVLSGTQDILSRSVLRIRFRPSRKCRHQSAAKRQ